ncbi:MAG TPA: four helix bundle protein [Candidatus Paceibacterota bacterium]|nr:four helix bundle protein [Candidatus Paceibacterota bacterium]
MIVKFPKNERFVLGQNIENQLLHILKLVNKINNIRDDRKRYYQELSEEIDILLILNRLTKDLRFVSVKQYFVIASLVNEIAKLACG